MIIYGWRSTVQTGQQLNQPCRSCEQRALRVLAQSRYAHVYWIPLFSLGRTKHLVCESCGATMAGRDIPADLKARIDQEGAAPRFPFHHFIGVAAIGVVALVMFVKAQLG